MGKKAKVSYLEEEEAAETGAGLLTVDDRYPPVLLNWSAPYT